MDTLSEWMSQKDQELAAKVDADDPRLSGGATSWDALVGKPSAFTPTAHTHVIGDTTGLQTALDGKAASNHTHTKANITDFTHTHAQSDITNLSSDLAGKANTVHTHATLPTTAYVALANGTTTMAFGTNGVVKVTPTATATFTTTVPAAGTRCTLLILTAGALSYTITFGTGFKPTATLATGTTAARVFVINWVSDGTNLYEAGRTAAMVA